MLFACLDFSVRARDRGSTPRALAELNSPGANRRLRTLARSASDMSATTHQASLMAEQSIMQMRRRLKSTTSSDDGHNIRRKNILSRVSKSTWTASISKIISLVSSFAAKISMSGVAALSLARACKNIHALQFIVCHERIEDLVTACCELFHTVTWNWVVLSRVLIIGLAGR